MKSDQMTYVAFANPFLSCAGCGERAVGMLADQEARNWPCLDPEDVVSLCPTWGPVDGCSCPEPVVHGLPPEGDRDKRKGRADASGVRQV